MNTSTKKFPWLHIALLVLFALPLFFLKISNVQTWGDDFAQYIKEADNIANGKPYYESNYIFNGLNSDYAPPSYPPGFALMLAPVVKVFGLQIAPMLQLISVLMALILFSLFFYFRKKVSDNAAFCISLIICYCAGVLRLKGYVLSDIPLLALCSLYFLLRTNPIAIGSRTRWTYYLTTAALLFLCILTRSQAILLLAAEGLFMLSQFFRKGIKSEGLRTSFIICMLTTALYLVFKVFVSDSRQDPMAYYSGFFQFNSSFFKMLAENLKMLWEMFNEFFLYDTENSLIKACLSIFSYTLLLLALLGCYRQVRKGPGLEFYFFILMCLLMLLLPVHQGLRFLIPVLPAYLFLVIEGFQFLQDLIKKQVSGNLIIPVTALLLLSGWETFGSAPFEDWTPYTAKDSIAFEYLKQKINKQDIIVFTKPRALTLFTDLRAVNIAWQKPQEANKRVFDSLGVKYMLTRADLDYDLIERYLRVYRPLDSTKIAGVYVLYRVK